MKIEKVALRCTRIGCKDRNMRKVVFTSIGNNCYLAQAYEQTVREGKEINEEKWRDSTLTTTFDGENVINGKVHVVNCDVLEYFELLIKHEGYKEVADNAD